VSLAEYIVFFVLVVSTGAGVPGPGDAAMIAAGTLAGEGRLNPPGSTKIQKSLLWPG
jgi:membrane protein DedA with SNARE-associated domain